MTALQEEAVRPLSFAQERMWLLDQIDPGAAAYNLFHAVDISGPLAPALLARSLDEVVRRHQILRTTFAAPGGAPEPRVAPAARRLLPLVDLAGLPEPSRRPEVARLSTEERRRPFDLAAGPLVRVALVRLAAGRHAGLLAAHPIVFDGGSSLVLWREVAALYEAFAAGRPSPLPEPPLQYADYALWQRLHLAGEALAGEVEPWRRELAPPLPVLRLPADFDRASARGFLAGEVHRVLPAPLAAALRELGGRRGATLSSTLLAAWAAVLARTSGEEDVLVGTPVDSRRPEAEGLIGPFRNTLVLRARPRLDRGYGPLVDEVREAAAGAGAHQDLPLEMLLTALDLPRDPRRAPPFQVLFLFRSQRSQPAPRLSFAGLRIAVSPPDPAADLAGEVFELGLVAEERSDPRGEGDGDGGIGLRLAYDAHLFTEATAARLLDHLAALLAAALAAPERPLAELPLLSTAERRQLLAWSDGGEARRRHGQAGAQPPLAHRAFLAQAARTPGAPAVVAEGREVSYGELARLARGLARRLVAQGIGPESRVAIALERSPRMVAAVLAVLAAGGAYVPLDPASPVERLAVILRDIGRDSGRDTGHDGGRGAVAAALLDRRRARGGARGGQARRPARRRPRRDLAGPRGRAGVGGRAGERPGERAGASGRPREPGLRHLHLGLDRRAQGGDDPPRRARELRPRGAAGPRAHPRRPHAAVRLPLLRRQRRGDLLLPGERRGARPPQRRDARRGAGLPGRLRELGGDRLRPARPSSGKSWSTGSTPARPPGRHPSASSSSAASGRSRNASRASAVSSAPRCG